ncbi:TniB family NTP-binding protein [Lentzea sp. BCCO 10_0798]|uniref:TniB family NTP-binding protein n=1 Tax=Lentzea kristufekii TaxID=3095430 RepID=A0ABU4TZV4_9PSEU|nr:TniB family NTP-binding protein [Lentzea sp. BCCO 10_0798]MDX8053843.1 TniB family NTP-binding protein [Lentzea sp. BCCO 10_0798]
MSSDPTTNTVLAEPSSLLPPHIPDRETVQGWQQWRHNRHAFIPAPRLELAAYRAMSPRDRQLHDLHRAATHANLPLLETPMSRAVARLMRSRLQTNALKHKPTTRAGLMITGGGYQGKTETACEVAAAFEDVWLTLHQHLNPAAVPGTRDLHAPVAYVQTPVTAKPKSLCQAILDFYGADYRPGTTLPQLTKAVRDSLRDHGTRVLLLDDITRLKMHRADDQDTLDLLRAFMSTHTTLVLIGVDIPGAGLLREGRHDPRTGHWVFPPPQHDTSADQVVRLAENAATQTERRFDLVHLGPFTYDTPAAITAWTSHLAGLEHELRLLHAAPGMLSSGTMPEYLFRRTGGVVGLLERLIEEGCGEAIATGTERLTDTLLDTIAINLGNDPRRDPAAGEIPVVPPNPEPPAATARRPRPRRRNTVFDDPGTPGAATR